jgi:hypothetical protein
MAASSQIRNPVAYSFGSVDAKQKLNLQKNSGTPACVGPNTYFPNHNALDRYQMAQNQPFTKAKRNMHSVDRSRYWDSHFDYSAVGKQVVSKHRSENHVSMPKASKTNQFVGLISRQFLRVSLPHAAY